MRLTSLALATSLVVLSACSEESSAPTAPTTAAAPELAVTTTAAGEVAIYPGTSIQAAVSRYPAGTTFLLKAGVHRRQSIVPKPGNTFLGERDSAGTRLSILDGEDATAYAFSPGRAPYPGNVRIQGLIIERYRPAEAQGAVSAQYSRDRTTTGWVIEDCDIRYNATGGLRLGNKIRVLRNYIHHNGQVGMIGSGDSVLAEGNEIAYNNYQKKYTWGFLLGGVKFVRTRWLVVRNNHVHHNWGNGLWTDEQNIYALIENNLVTDQAGAGIFHEISYDAVIRNNTVERNGFERGWLYGAGILIGHSPNVEVYGNVVRNNKHGIAGIQQDRSRWPAEYGPHLLKNLYVHDNSVTMPSGMTGVGQGGGYDAVFSSSWNNRFRNNSYVLGRTLRPFAWQGTRTEAQWKSYGHDVTGTFTR